MAQSETAEATHGGSLEDATQALEGFDFDLGEFVQDEPSTEEAPVEASEDGEDEEVEATEEEAEDEQEELIEAEPVEDAQTIDAPVSWSDEQKEVFATLPPDAQNVILTREGERDKGFQQKATELAEQKREYDAAMQQMNHERQQYAQTIHNNINEGLTEPDLDLLVTNPQQYRDEKIAFDQMLQLRDQARQQADHYANENKREEDTQRNAFYQQRNGELAESLPAFIQDVQYRDGVLAYGREAGYSDSDLEMARTADIIIIDKAKKYDALIAAKPAITDKLKVAPKVVKPGTRQNGTKQSRATKANLTAHKKNGNVHTAAAALKGYFDD